MLYKKLNLCQGVCSLVSVFMAMNLLELNFHILYCIFMSCSGPVMLPVQVLHKNVFLSQVTVFY